MEQPPAPGGGPQPPEWGEMRPKFIAIAARAAMAYGGYQKFQASKG